MPGGALGSADGAVNKMTVEPSLVRVSYVCVEHIFALSNNGDRDRNPKLWWRGDEFRLSAV